MAISEILLDFLHLIVGFASPPLCFFLILCIALLNLSSFFSSSIFLSFLLPLSLGTLKETENNNINDNINLEEKNKKTKISQPHEQKSKNKNIKEEKYKQNSVNINLKIMDDLNCNKSLKSNNIPGNVSDRASSVNSPIHINIRKSKKRGGSIPERKNTKNDAQETEFIHNSSSRAFHQVINIFYGKEFPSKIKTNEILKLMLFFNEYLINNNLLSDYQDEKNRKLLNDYSKYISSKIDVDFPQEQDIVVDPSIKCVKKIQRKWRKRKIDKFLYRK